MLGGIVMAVILVLVFPVVFLIGMALLASGIGTMLKRDSDVRNEGTELFTVSEADLYQRRN